VSAFPGPGDGWHRLHPLSPVVRSLRGLIALLAVAGLSASGMASHTSGQSWLDIAVPVAAALAALVNWLVTRWKLDGGTLRIETGLLRRDSRQLPVARIQAVDLVRPFLARMLGLAELRLRLAGTGHADGRLAYLTEPAAVALRARLLAAHHGLDPATPEPPEQILVTVPTGRIIGSVLLASAGLAGFAAAGGVLLAVVFPVGFAAAAGALVWWAAVGATLLWQRISSQYGFTVAASPDGIRIRRGLLGTVAETIPVPRVQAVRLVEPLLWRPVGWLRLEVDVAGHPGHDKAAGGSAMRKALLPVGNWREAGDLVRLTIGGGTFGLSRPPRRARWKAPLSYHYLAAGHDDRVAVTVTGRLRRVTAWVPLAKAQSVRLVQGPLQRRFRLATVHLDAAGKHVQARFSERDHEEAERLAGELAALSRTARRRSEERPGPGLPAVGAMGTAVPPPATAERGVPGIRPSGPGHVYR
jgi:putative membrane protein